MRILHVYKDYFPAVGGIENHVRDVAEAFAQRGHEVTVLVTNPSGRNTVEEMVHGVRVIRAGQWGVVASTPLSFAFPQLLHSLQPDITHVHSPYPIGEVGQWWMGKRPYVVTYHADVTRPVQQAIMLAYAPLLKLILRRASRVMATSANYAATSPYLRGATDHLSIVTLGVDPHRYQPIAKSTPPTPITVLFLGLLRHYKGVEFLIRAMRDVPAPTRLMIAGGGPLRAELEAVRDTLGLQKRVTFLGRVPDADLPQLYQTADIFVLPAISRAEALGVVLIEAMASGLPCITTEIGSGNSYLVQNHVTGLTVPPRAPLALAEAINRLAADPALRQQLGEAGRQRVLENFTTEIMLKKIELVYQQVVGSAPA